MTVASWIGVGITSVSAVLAARQIVGWRRDRILYRKIDKMLTARSRKRPDVP